ncbi:unnamed protein product [marine sediment metagenome]|uniref:Uncharacterized protein n=1 Tax=marine sediment metagenome TaxID=412755 RepID=X1CAZ6_9ZZZZ
MNTPAEKAKRTRAKNLKAKQEQEKKIARANSGKRNAENKLKWYIKGREDEAKVRRD